MTTYTRQRLWCAITLITVTLASSQVTAETAVAESQLEVKKALEAVRTDGRSRKAIALSTVVLPTVYPLTNSDNLLLPRCVLKNKSVVLHA